MEEIALQMVKYFEKQLSIFETDLNYKQLPSISSFLRENNIPTENLKDEPLRTAVSTCTDIIRQIVTIGGLDGRFNSHFAAALLKELGASSHQDDMTDSLR